MKRHEAVLSVRFGGEAGLVVVVDGNTGGYRVGNLPSSPVSNMWCLDSDYKKQSNAISAAKRLAADAGRELREPTELRTGFLVFEFLS